MPMLETYLRKGQDFLTLALRLKGIAISDRFLRAQQNSCNIFGA